MSDQAHLVPMSGADYEGHLHGIQLFMNTQDQSYIASGLRKASFWIGLRQEIVMAFVNQRPLRLKLDQNFIDRSFSAANDDTWANRIIVHCGEVLSYCFGDSQQSITEYQNLKSYDEGWLQA